ncbi:photosystem I reaction center subunit VIII [Nostoc sp. FACHB-87]|uniref:Photosystem I reaction center subunit VIII n=1 Tax=Nostoc spongiaeforme FACHB-130 TaxID=1357510 RepID=A0ABR8G4D7_9NOSO|nr:MULTISPECIES: photosystem I reaction center subunit VIII [Nostocales]MBD2297554.1 photosystem I reaction center subunit VIII [Nostoc sp. FACHB-190]MBD2452610.1 photosystem I reaction center subunit VIII [Nostoc sp. FACHB-87]MBD2473541.1 photosystem I reaction center subunit VIII [Anabaena sp. FACHB-83]MBD2486206.1 photosystem I reaction center subunit VIII [Aulosira sp. FACHB-615]MBD2493860.1 photosystem I reaction center subunit VIII [Nostoc sp. FACHB-280]
MSTELFPQIFAYSASFLSPIFVPIIGWVLPIATFSFLLLYIERDDIA